MADPSIVALTADTWTAVLTGVTTGLIHLRNTARQYRYTYREAGGTAPTDSTDALLAVSRTIAVSHSSAIDVYVISIGAAGSLLVVV